jgi:hypothetical protein
MMDGLYELRMMTPTAIRFGVLLKNGAVLLARAGDWIAFGITRNDHLGPVVDLVIWESEPASAQPLDERAGEHVRVRGLVSRGGARLVAESGSGPHTDLAIHLSLFRAPSSRAVAAWR